MVAQAQPTCERLLETLEVREEPRRTSYERPGRGAYRDLEPATHAGLGMDRTPYACTEIGGDEVPARAGRHRHRTRRGAGRGVRQRAAGRARRRVSGDPANLTLATPRENRYRTSDRDAADYAPPFNACWWACQSIRVKARYGLSVDSREKAGLRHLLAGYTPACPARTAR